MPSLALSPAARRSALWMLLAAVPAIGCTSLVLPPVQVARPASVYVLREAMHVGIVVPDPVHEPTRYVEYGYGDWAWYALGQEAWWRAIPTVVWPTQGTYCRRVWAARDGDSLARLLAQHGCEADVMQVEGERVVEFARGLEGQFQGGAEVRREELRMDFVKAEGGYWFLNTCADVAAEWCESLGCDVGWALIRSSLRVNPRTER